MAYSGDHLYWAADPEIDRLARRIACGLLCMRSMGNYWIYFPAQRFPLSYDMLPVVPI
jgi:hypothetical protein